MDTWPTWLGDLPTWITTAAVLIAAGQYVAERRRRAEDAVRESRAQASGLAVWTVTLSPDRSAWGVQIVNTSGSTFHDVQISARMFDHPVSRPIELRILPPGDYFVPFDRRTGWQLPQRAEECEGWLRPLAVTEKCSITEMQFTDNRNRLWITDDSAVLRAG